MSLAQNYLLSESYLKKGILILAWLKELDNERERRVSINWKPTKRRISEMLKTLIKKRSLYENLKERERNNGGD